MTLRALSITLWSCVENKKVMFSFLFISAIKSNSVEVDWLSKFAVGSSAKIKRGFEANRNEGSDAKPK